ncbi:hypothetical protein BN2475_750027 [Paraburkholderia ribeironis]|uniref:Uncharacterized protein n=1 Tax=Paraburkholderia ribeironis TaxID=1247936 RepID=A0A1N7SKM7_9BURK|nr:hypothetical protein BN2475_750027 [Paraburkholderia ribeironis]
METASKAKRTVTSDPVRAYARDVVAGKIIAEPRVRAACKRHLQDVKLEHERGLKWEKAAATRVFGFFEDVLHLNVGQYEDPRAHGAGDRNVFIEDGCQRLPYGS